MEISTIVNYFGHNWLVILLLLGAGTANAIMDKLQFHFSVSIFVDKGTWWNPKLSWINKWKLDAEGKPIVGKDRFIGSSTFLVLFTDAWHCFQFVMLTLFTMAIVAYTPFDKVWYMFIVDIVIFKLVFSLAFTVNWKWFLEQK